MGFLLTNPYCLYYLPLDSNEPYYKAPWHKKKHYSKYKNSNTYSNASLSPYFLTNVVATDTVAR